MAGQAQASTCCALSNNNNNYYYYKGAALLEPPCALSTRGLKNAKILAPLVSSLPLNNVAVSLNEEILKESKSQNLCCKWANLLLLALRCARSR